MRKRSKKRIPQDIKAWAGLKSQELDIFALPGKKTSRWVAGGRRDWNTRVLNASNRAEVSKIMLTSLNRSLSTESSVFVNLLVRKLAGRNLDKTTSLAKYKNFCLVSGRGRTYSRSLYMARHNVRKLVGLGLISGLNK